MQAQGSKWVPWDGNPEVTNGSDQDQQWGVARGQPLDFQVSIILRPKGKTVRSLWIHLSSTWFLAVLAPMELGKLCVYLFNEANMFIF